MRNTTMGDRHAQRPPTPSGPPRILIVDDDADVREVVSEVLLRDGLEVVQAEDGRTGLERARADLPTAVVLDISMPNMDGLEVLRQLKTLAPQLPVIMLTSTDDIRVAVEAMQLGAYDYVTKPFELDELTLHVRRAVERQALLDEISSLRSELAHGGTLATLMGTSQAMRAVIESVGQVARSVFSVLIMGETGTGKELVARAIHHESPRRDKPFIALDCGALPETLIESELFGYEKGAFTGADRRKEGHFQLADGGTLFLDEVANLPTPTQAKLLRVLQERHVWRLGAKAPVPVDVRIIAACNVSLEEEMKAGHFRQDLYFRLNEFAIRLPALRARVDDILPLATRFMEEAGLELKRRVRGFSKEAVDLLLRHSWPGNVREMKNAVRRAVLLAATDVIGPKHLDDLRRGAAGMATPEPTAATTLVALKEARDRGAAEAEQQAIRAALVAARGNKSEAARLLQTDFKTLHVKMRQYGISLTDRLPS